MAKKSKAGTGEELQAFSVRLPAKLVEEIEFECQRARWTKSTYIRHVVRVYQTLHREGFVVEFSPAARDAYFSRSIAPPDLLGEPDPTPPDVD